MTGCVVVDTTLWWKQASADPEKTQFSKDVTLWMTALRDVRVGHEQFEITAAQKRNQILQTFSHMQEILTVNQRHALAAYDGEVCSVHKRFLAELVALEVRANQAVVPAAAVTETFSNSTPSEQYTSVPQFVHVSLNDVKAVLAALWSVIGPSQLPPVLPEVSLSDAWEKFSSLEAARIQLEKLTETVNALNTVLESFRHRWNAESVSFADVLQPRRWSGTRVATYPIDFEIGGMAVANDVSIMAVSNFKEHYLTMYELPSGKQLGKFGSAGNAPGQYAGPLRLCFTPHDTVLVADSGNKRVQEVTTTGNHVRTLQCGEFTSPVLHVTCNANVILASQQYSSRTICVFDMRSGSFLTGFGTAEVDFGLSASFRDITMSFDGTRLLIPNEKTGRVLVFAVDGTFSNVLGKSLALESGATSVTELPDGRIVIANTKKRFRVFEPSGVQSRYETCLVPRFEHNDSLTQLRFVSGFLFVSGQSVIECYT